MNILTEYVPKPIPLRQFDWEAWDDDTYDGPPCPVGTGASEEEAIADLKTQIEERQP